MAIKVLTLQDHVDMVYRRRWLLIIPPVLGLLAAVALAFTLPKAYLSSTLILVEPQKVPEEYVKATVGSIEERLATIRQQLFSRSLLQRIIDEFKLYEAKAAKSTNEEIIEKMRQQVTVDTVKGKNVNAFTISFVGDDPATTMNVANRLASLFIEENLKIREQLVEGTSDFLDVELARLKEKLEAQERSLSDYKQHYMGSLPTQMEANLRTLDRLQLQLQATTTSLSNAMDRQLALEIGPLPSLDANDPAAARQPVMMTPSDPRVLQLQALRRRLTTLQAEYTESYPDIQTVKQEISRLEAELTRTSPQAAPTTPTAQAPGTTTTQPRTAPIASSSTQNPLVAQDIARLQQQQAALQQQIQLYQKRVEETPKREQELSSLTRDYETTKQSYDILLGKAGNAKISENLEKRQKGEQFRIMDTANLPEKPFKPNLLKLVAVGLVLGLGVGGGLAMMLENLDTSVKQSEELEEAFGIPVLGVIPKATSLRRISTRNGTSVAHSPAMSKESMS